MELMNATLKLWTVESYERLAESGAFAPGERVELIEGMIVAIAAHNYKHSRALSHGTTLLVEAFGQTHYVRVQLPLNLGLKSQLEPDFAIVLKDLVDAADAHPAQADLVIELSDSSLSYDRNEKARVYAQAGIPEYWIVNLKADVVEVHRDPGQTSEGWGYLSRRVVNRGEMVQPLFCPQQSIPTEKLF